MSAVKAEIQYNKLNSNNNNNKKNNNNTTQNKAH